MKTWQLVLYVNGFEVRVAFQVSEDVYNSDAYEIGEEFAKNFPHASYGYVET